MAKSGMSLFFYFYSYYMDQVIFGDEEIQQK